MSSALCHDRGRIEVIDILRGLALFGIAIVNTTIDGNDYKVVENAYLLDWTDRVSMWLILVFVDDKFRALFSCLFGVGFAILTFRVEQRGLSVVRVYSRRLIVLAAIGLLHSLLTPITVLFWYALLGFFLLAVRNWPGRRVIALALVCLLAPWIASGVRVIGANFGDGSALNSGAARTNAANDVDASNSRVTSNRVVRNGNLSEVLRFHAKTLRSQVGSLRTYVWVFSDLFPMFLIGFWIGRCRIFEAIPTYKNSIRRVTILSMILGLAGALFHVSMLYFHEPGAVAPDLWLRRFAALAGAVSTPVLTVGYIGLITLANEHHRWNRLLRPLAPFGRMALTNYILQLLIIVGVVYGIGLGLHGDLAPTLASLVAVAMTIVLWGFSVLWLKNHPVGPAEGLWRRLAGRPKTTTTSLAHNVVNPAVIR